MKAKKEILKYQSLSQFQHNGRIDQDVIIYFHIIFQDSHTILFLLVVYENSTFSTL